MSCYEWQHGELTLPSAAVAPVKKAVRDTQNRLRDEVLRLCKEFWAGPAKRTSSTKLYRERLETWAYPARPLSPWAAPRSSMAEVARDLAHEALSQLAGKPRQVQQADLDQLVPRATNRTTHFRVGWEASISFDGREVLWDVPENNHAVESARQHPVAQALFAALDKVTWTRGTGGVLTYNNEYARDSYDAGAGANQISAWYGPLGERDFAQANGYNPRTHKPVRRRGL